MYIIAIPPVSLGDVTVEITPPTEETATIEEFEDTGSGTIPAGQRYVEIYVAGIVVDGDTEGPAIISGEVFNVGDTFKFESAPQLDKVPVSPEIAYDGQGARLFIKYWTI